MAMGLFSIFIKRNISFSTWTISYKYIDIHKYIYTYILIIFIFMGSHYLLICWAQYILCCDPWIPWAPWAPWAPCLALGLFETWRRHAERMVCFGTRLAWKTLGKWQNIYQKRTCFCNIGQWFSYLSLFLIMMWSKQNGTVGHYLIAFSQQKCGPIGPIGIDPGPVHVGMPWRSVHRSLAMDWLVAGSDRLGLDQTKFRSHFDQI
jgi:hypothetical protein